MSERDELMEDIRAIDGPAALGGDVLADGLIAAGYRKIFDGDCGLSGIKAPDEREAAEAWMRWANLAMNDEIGAIGAMKRMLTEFGYRRPRVVTTVAELDALRFESVITDAYGTPYVCQRHMTDSTRNDWRMSGMDTLDLSEDIVVHGPFTVRYEGNK